MNIPAHTYFCMKASLRHHMMMKRRDWVTVVMYIICKQIHQTFYRTLFYKQHIIITSRNVRQNCMVAVPNQNRRKTINVLKTDVISARYSIINLYNWSISVSTLFLENLFITRPTHAMKLDTSGRKRRRI